RLRELNNLVIVLKAKYTSSKPAKDTNTKEGSNLYKTLLLLINYYVMLTKNI
ncbi:hypothetical protein K504DRAFT_392409, partial [Pleomassaria siparia CBS 279.74]